MAKTVPIEQYFAQIEGAIEALLDRFETRIGELQESLDLTELGEDDEPEEC